MRAAIYARVSTTDQTNALQIAELRRYAQARRWKVVEIYQDTATGATTARPGLTAVLEAARARAIDVILVWKLDRFGRSTVNLLNNLRELEAAGVRFIATTQGIDTDTANPVSRFLISILSAAAELERELIGERVRAGIAAARARGVEFGRPAAVFRRDQAVILRAQGMSFRAIANELNTSHATVYRYLRANTTP